MLLGELLLRQHPCVHTQTKLTTSLGNRNLSAPLEPSGITAVYADIKGRDAVCDCIEFLDGRKELLRKIKVGEEG